MPFEKGRAYARVIVGGLPSGEEVLVEFAHQKVAIYRRDDGPACLQLMARERETASLSRDQLLKGAGFLAGLADFLPEAEGEEG